MGETLTVVGAGYVGLVSAVGLAELGHEVHCIETDPNRLAMLRRGEVPFFEPGLEEALRDRREQLHFASDYEQAAKVSRLFFVAVGTPTGPSGEADLSAVWSVIDGIPLSDGQAVVMKSTVPPGTGVECRRRLDARGRGLVAYVSCPEFLSESTGLADFREPDRVVIGDDGGWAGDAVEEVYTALVGPEKIIRTDPTTAETLKLAANAFLSAKISFINEMANVCDAAGADVTTLARAIGLDPRIGPLFLRAGIGFGGSCFDKDLKSLAHEASRLGVRAAMVEAVLDVNDHQWARVLDKLSTAFGDVDGRVVAVLGLAFKPGTSNVRCANSLPLLDGLARAGARVRAYDPKATAEIVRRDGKLGTEVLDSITFCDSALAAVEGADASVLVTEWPELLALDWPTVAGAMRGALLIDGRNALDPDVVTAGGLDYTGIGRPTVGPAGPK
jgi:UDPglucose 6-dehydrogenase